MNLHLPQSLDAQAELAELMAVQKNMISTQTGRPMMSLHQDSLLAVYLLTQPNRYFDFDTTTQFCYDIPGFEKLICMDGTKNNKTKRFSGTDIFSILFPDDFQYDKTACTIKNGKIIHCPNGISKDQIGPKNEGIMHILHRYHGAKVCVDFLDNAQTILRRFMEYDGFTVGIRDCMLFSPSTKKPVLGNIDYGEDETIARIELQKEMMAIGDSIQKIPEAQNNRFTAMMKAGSKGSSTNLTQICGIVGQQVVNGQRIHRDFPDRTLSHFQKFDNSATARGYVQGNYINGLNPTEFFFHAAGGREGLTDTAIKTSDTGYLYRKLEKSTESISVRYDNSVRNCNEDVVQIIYGEDSIDPVAVVKSNLPITHPSLMHKYNNSSVQPSTITLEQYSSDNDEIMYWNSLLIELWGCPPAEERTTTEWLTAVDIVGLCKRVAQTQRNEIPELQIQFQDLLDRMQSLLRKITRQNTKGQSCFEPSLIFKIHLAFHLRLQITRQFTTTALNQLFTTIENKYLCSLVCPGDPVGGLCASACSAPATQMTLNTFHLAGTGSKVTSGLKRLAELYNDSCPHQTSMKIFLKDSTKSKREIRDLAQKIQAVTLDQAIIAVHIKHDNNTLDASYSFMKTWHIVYDKSPQGIQFNAGYLSSFYIEMELNRSLLLKLGISITDVRRIILEHFPALVIIASPQFSEKLLLLIFIPIDPNEDHIRPKARNRNQATKASTDRQDGNNRIMESWDFWNKHHQSLWESILISGEPNISDAIIEKMPFREEHYIQVSGNNLTGLCNYEDIDEYKTILNQVQITSDLLGIEAARAVLYAEISEVLANAGVVDPRHVLLLVDTMTYHGDIAGNTRHSMAKSDIGFIEKSCFESGDKFLLHAAVTNQLDDLKGVSAQVAFGLRTSLGTGAFDLLLNTKNIVGNVIEHETENVDSAEYDSSDSDGPSYRPVSPKCVFGSELDSTDNSDEEEQEDEFIPSY